MSNDIEAKALACAAARSRPDAAGQPWRVLGVLSVLMGFASISTDLYLPALPEMAHALFAPIPG
ncbi:hypothetical protein AB4Z40_02470 [Bosea sp. 2YAB26]|uniref:hypothetical protein n=1 Tax=Bosea sp. 2YAB26 TaxID=3237478 RepID=UPI003F8E2E89